MQVSYLRYLYYLLRKPRQDILLILQNDGMHLRKRTSQAYEVPTSCSAYNDNVSMHNVIVLLLKSCDLDRG